MKRALLSAISAVLWCCAPPAFAQFEFGSGSGALHVVGASLPACTPSIIYDYVLVDATSRTDTAGGAVSPYDVVNYLVCDRDDSVWRVLASSLDATPAVSSVHGRTGAVVGQPGDYTVTDIPGAVASATLAGTGASQGAGLVGIRDIAGHYTATTVEDALSEVYELAQAGGGGGGATNLGANVGASTVTVTSDTGGDAIIPAATSSSAGVQTAADKAQSDAFGEPYDKILRITDRTTACAVYSGAFEEYHDGTAPEGTYRVKVTFDLTGANALRPAVDFWDDGGNWPYSACFVHHPQAAGAYINTTGGAFPDSLGRLTNGAAAVNQTSGVEVLVDVDGDIEIDKTSQAKNALLWEDGNSYLAGCDEGGSVNSSCGETHYGTMSGALRMRGAVSVKIATQNDGSWTGEGTPSMSKTARLSAEAPTFFAIFANDGGTYSDLHDFTITPTNMGHTDMLYHQVNGWGTKPPRLNAAQPQDGIGAMLYGFVNMTGAGREWSLKNLDHSVLLGDANNGGFTVFYQSCDALDSVNGTCGNGSGVGLYSVTTGVEIDGLMAEGGAGSWSTISIPVVGATNRFRNVYGEQTSGFSGIGTAIGPQYCDGVSGTSPKPKGKIVAEDSECASSGGVAAPAPTAASAVTNGVLEISYASAYPGLAGTARGLLLGEGCIADKMVLIGGPAKLHADANGDEFVIAASIASSGGCRLVVGTDPNDGTLTAYYNLVRERAFDSAIVDDELARYDATTGLMVGSGVTIDDAGNMAVPGEVSTGDPGNNARAYKTLSNTSSLGTPATDQCRIGLVGASVATAVPYYHCDGGSLTAIGSGSTGYSTIQDEASTLTQRTTVNFTGAGVSCADNAGSGRTDCTIAGGGGSLPVDDTTALVRDPVDNTKLVRVDAGAVATGTTRTITMPNFDVDLGALLPRAGGSITGSITQTTSGIYSIGSNYNLILKIDADNNSIQNLQVQNGAGTPIFLIDETGAVTISGALGTSGAQPQVVLGTIGSIRGGLSLIGGDAAGGLPVNTYRILPPTTGSTSLDLYLPSTAGASTNALKTNGSGVLSWGAVAFSELSGAISGGAGGQITDGSITADDLAADSVTASEIGPDAVGASEIAADAVGASEIAADAVGSSEIAANAVGSSELADNAVDTAAIQDASVSPAKLDSSATYSVGALNTADPGDNGRAYETPPNSTSLGTPATGECRIGLVGASVAAATPYFHCDGGSLTAFGGGSSTLAGLTDANITSPAVGAALKWDGTDWIDGPIDLADADARTGTLPVANGGTGITAFGTGVATAMGVNTGSAGAFGVVALRGNGATVDGASVTSGSCVNVDVTATGAASTDAIAWSFAGPIDGITGFNAASTSGSLNVHAYPITNAIRFRICNPTAGTLDPGALTVNWRILR